MTNIRKPSIGSISEGTMRTADLLSSFAWELKHLSDNPENVALTEEAERRSQELDQGDGGRDETEEDQWCLERLFDVLQDLAPPYCYFGASEGDGASYGFWPDMDSVNELPRITMTEGEDIPAEDHVYVNDHGNVTLYGADGNMIWDCV